MNTIKLMALMAVMAVMLPATTGCGERPATEQPPETLARLQHARQRAQDLRAAWVRLGSPRQLAVYTNDSLFDQYEKELADTTTLTPKRYYVIRCHLADFLINLDNHTRKLRGYQQRLVLHRMRRR
jgi:hypothetical protein